MMGAQLHEPSSLSCRPSHPRQRTRLNGALRLCCEGGLMLRRSSCLPPAATAVKGICGAGSSQQRLISQRFSETFQLIPPNAPLFWKSYVAVRGKCCTGLGYQMADEEFVCRRRVPKRDCYCAACCIKPCAGLFRNGVSTHGKYIVICNTDSFQQP